MEDTKVSNVIYIHIYIYIYIYIRVCTNSTCKSLRMTIVYLNTWRGEGGERGGRGREGREGDREIMMMMCVCVYKRSSSGMQRERGNE